jgi:hypothetical protein
VACSAVIWRSHPLALTAALSALGVFAWTMVIAQSPSLVVNTGEPVNYEYGPLRDGLGAHVALVASGILAAAQTTRWFTRGPVIPDGSGAL